MTRCILIFLLMFAYCLCIHAQNNDKVDVFIKISNKSDSQPCRDFALGSPIESITPAYPEDARALRLGGAVRVELLVSKEGAVSEVLSITGEKLLTGAALEAALKTRFKPSRCGKQPVESAGVLIFNFVPLALTDLYTVPERASGFSDIDKHSPYYEPVLTLTENYRLSFGYADGNFHPEAPVTKGEFAHSLRLTLDLLQKRAEIARKIPLEIELYFPSNSNRLRSVSDITDMDSKRPYYQSVAFLISKYDIALTNENRELNGDQPISRPEIIGYWETIFGGDAVPVNFVKSGEEGVAMTRGDFALFLYESLFVLTYKVLP